MRFIKHAQKGRVFELQAHLHHFNIQRMCICVYCALCKHVKTRNIQFELKIVFEIHLNCTTDNLIEAIVQ